MKDWMWWAAEVAWDTFLTLCLAAVIVAGIYAVTLSVQAAT